METTEYFIGLRKDQKSGEWRWISDNSTVNALKGTFPWANEEPSGDGNCTVVYKKYLKDFGKYNDLKCTKELRRAGYICESHAENRGTEEPTVKETSQTKSKNKLSSTKPTAMQSLAVISGTHSTISKHPLTETNFEATTARNTMDDFPSEKTARNNSSLIIIVLTILAVLILIILIIFCVISVRRRRNFKRQVKSRVKCNFKNLPSSGQQAEEHAQHLGSTTELTLHLTLSRTDWKGESTYANVNKTDNRKSRSDRQDPFTHVGGTEKHTGPDDGYCLAVDTSRKMDDPREFETNRVVCIENEKQEENKSQAYAVVHKDSRWKVSGGSLHSKARMETSKTANSRKEESTYETVQLTNRKSRSDGGEYISREEDGERKKARSIAGCCIPLDNTPDPDAKKKSGTHGVADVKSKKKEESKDRVYAVVNRSGKGNVSGASFHDKARCSLKDDTPLEPVNRLSSVELVNRLSSVQPAVRLSSLDPVNFSSPEAEMGLNHHKAVADKDGPAGDEKKDYVYAVVNKANKKRKAPQMPSPYRGLVYADLSHPPASNTGLVKKGLPTIYADIDNLRTDTASSKIPEENLDQATKDDGP